MIKAEATGDKFSYGVVIRGYVDYGEYEQILENIEEIKSKSKHSEKSVDMRRRKPMSEKYTYADVIIDPDDPRVEIGKEYYFGDNPTSLLYGVQHNWPIRKLEDVSNQAPSISPFYNGSSFFACLIRKKEPVKKYVPLNLNDREDLFNLMGSWLMNKTCGSYHCVITIKPAKNLVYIDGYGEIGPQELLEDFIFVFNDSPCGKLVEEE